MKYKKKLLFLHPYFTDATTIIPGGWFHIFFWQAVYLNYQQSKKYF